MSFYCIVKENCNGSDPEELESNLRNFLKSFRRDFGHTDGYELNNLKEIFKFSPGNYFPVRDQIQLES